MTDEPMAMTCAQVDEALSDYLEETLDVASHSRVDEHLAGCLRCSAILRDVGVIRSEAARLPELAPSRDLWEGISARIEPTVLPLGVRTGRDLPRRWVPIAAAAAAALVIATAGITYVATSRSLGTGAERVAVSLAPSVTTEKLPGAAPAPAAEPAVAEAPSTPTAGDARGPEPRQPARGAGTAALASRRSTVAASPGELAYGDDIQRLQTIITERRRELDPATVSVIEESLKIIDAAVKQSRGALARDPKSGFLADQLNNALEKKVELLRTVALLPSST
jgi:hypothetical protein